MANDETTGRRVLVIDDDPGVLMVITKALRLLGDFDVAVASEGAEGLTRFFEVKPDCVVVDIRMPGLDGYQFMRALRGDPETASVPIIVVSALVRDHEQLAGALAGADAYLVKPVKMADLVESVRQALHLSDDERAARIRLLAAESEASDERR